MLVMAALQSTKHGAKSSGSRSVIGRHDVRSDFAFKLIVTEERKEDHLGICR